MCFPCSLCWKLCMCSMHCSWHLGWIYKNIVSQGIRKFVLWCFLSHCRIDSCCSYIFGICIRFASLHPMNILHIFHLLLVVKLVHWLHLVQLMIWLHNIDLCSALHFQFSPLCLLSNFKIVVYVAYLDISMIFFVCLIWRICITPCMCFMYSSFYSSGIQ